MDRTERCARNLCTQSIEYARLSLIGVMVFTWRIVQPHPRPAPMLRTARSLPPINDSGLPLARASAASPLYPPFVVPPPPASCPPPFFVIHCCVNRKEIPGYGCRYIPSPRCCLRGRPGAPPLPPCCRLASAPQGQFAPASLCPAKATMIFEPSACRSPGPLVPVVAGRRPRRRRPARRRPARPPRRALAPAALAVRLPRRAGH